MAKPPAEGFPLFNALLLIWILAVIGGMAGYLIARAVGMTSTETVIAAGLGSLIGMTVIYFIKSYFQGPREGTEEGTR